MGLVQNIEMEQERREKERREKGKGIVVADKENPNFDDDLVNHCDAVNMFLVEKETTVVSAKNDEVSDGHSFTGEREEIERENETIMGSHQQTSKLLRPCVVLTSDQRPRLRWTLELHTCFVNAVMKLGGPHSQ